MENISCKVKVLIVDDQELIRTGLALILSRSGFDVVSAEENFDGALFANQRLNPDVVLLDLNLSEGLIVNRIHEFFIKATPKVLIYSSLLDSNNIYLQSFIAGAVGVISKDQPIDLLCKAIQAINNGEMWIGRRLSAQLVEYLREINKDNQAKVAILEQVQSEAVPNFGAQTSIKKPLLSNYLTTGEVKITCLASRGLSAKKIAEHLFISEKTVRNNLTIIYDKFQVSGQVELCLILGQFSFCELEETGCSPDSCSKFIKQKNSSSG